MRGALVRLVVCALLLAAGCDSPGTSLKRPSGPAIASPTGDEFTQPIQVLELAPGPLDAPGTTAAQDGGVLPHGPGSLAIGDQGEVFLLDWARARILEYHDGRLRRTVNLPYVDGSEPQGLLANDDRLYLCEGATGMEISLDGALLRLSGPCPRPRPRHDFPLDAGPQEWQLLGADAPGHRYFWGFPDGRPRLIRVHPGGRVLATSSGYLVAGTELVDVYVTAGGAVYGLTWTRGPDLAITAVAVLRLMDPIQTPEPETPVPPSPPAVLGRPVPDALAVTHPDWLSGTITDPATLRTVWTMLAETLADGGAVWEPDWPVLRLSAAWETETLELEVQYGAHESGAIRADGKLYTGTVSFSAISAALHTPGRLATAAGGAVTVSCPSQPTADRALTASERQMLVGLLAGSQRVGRLEPPPDPNPGACALLLQSEDGSLTLVPRGNGYFSLGFWRSADALGAFQAGSEFDRTVSAWLPSAAP